ncbi:uncharacterized protein SEPMUDRAFT_114630 [Sphaerulina musiva SO2202]|uniref:Uncharacterized protein n=1 Tax=Sphaerulina musiva (strain SO2202) TaxID=692275 RepID=M3B6U9_SPHMS|nr:uncharacterized protein SEPMUDRAFT_114630 [Sphaerulina musiva SO2202]EMF15537.1 hypothetical protein SEPMUDRAFT_114630 [Sphaerulina musiva SO2202]
MPPVVSILLALDRDSILRIVVRAQRSAWSGLVAACRRSITSDCDNMIDMPLFGNDVMLHNGEPDVPILLRGISVCCWGHPLLLASLVYSHVSTLQGVPVLEWTVIIAHDGGSTYAKDRTRTSRKVPAEAKLGHV